MVIRVDYALTGPLLYFNNSNFEDLVNFLFFFFFVFVNLIKTFDTYSTTRAADYSLRKKNTRLERGALPGKPLD